MFNEGGGLVRNKRGQVKEPGEDLLTTIQKRTLAIHAAIVERVNVRTQPFPYHLPLAAPPPAEALDAPTAKPRPMHEMLSTSLPGQLL